MVNNYSCSFYYLPCDLFFVTSDIDFVNHVVGSTPYVTENYIDRVISNFKIPFKKNLQSFIAKQIQISFI